MKSVAFRSILRSIFCAFFFCFVLFSQSQSKEQLDSIRHNADTSSSYDKSVKNYLRLAHYYAKRQRADSIDKYADLADSLLQFIPHRDQYDYKIYSNKLWANWIRGNYVEATDWAILLDPELEKINTQIASGEYPIVENIPDTIYLNEHWNALSDLYRKIGDFEKSYVYVIKSLEYAQSISYEYGIADSYNNLGILYDLQDQPEEAIVHYNKAIEINKRLGKNRRWQLGTNYNNLGIIFKNKETFDSSQLMYEAALSIMVEMKQDYGRGVVLDNLGTMFNKKGDYDEAVIYHQQALELMRELGSRDQESEISINLSDNYLNLGELDKAQELAEAAFQIAKTDEQWENVRTGSKMLSQIYEAKGNTAKALEFYKTFHDEYERFQNEETSDAVENLRIKYETQQKINENELLKTQVTVSESRIERQQLYIVIVAVVLVFVLVILFILYKVYQHSKRQRRVIEEQANKLQELDQYKSRFFANISHDLRTPLTLIGGRLNQLKEDSSNILSVQSQSYLESLIEYNKHLQVLVDDMKELMVIESDKINLNFECKPVLSYVKSTVYLFQSYADLKNINLLFEQTFDDDRVIHLDSNQINKVIYNLLSNAFKFTDTGGTVSVFLDANENGIELKVSDTGIGIEKSHLDKIFNRYYQADNQYFQREGLGIGLSLVKEIVELHSGVVTVESEIHKGTTFTVFLPYNLDKDVEAVVPSSVKEFSLANLQPQEHVVRKFSTNPKTGNEVVLIVDDHDDVRGYIHEVLQEHFNVLEATNGEEALKVLEQRKVDVVVTDLMMPFMDGFGLLDAMNDDPRFTKLPILVVSARVGLEERREVLNKGVNDFLSKPFDKEEMILRVRNLLNGAQQTGQQVHAESDLRETVLDKLDHYLIKHIDRQISVEELANELLTSNRNLYRMIKTLTGMTPLEYQNDLKYKFAYEMLSSQQVSSLKEASMAIGVKNVTYFKKQMESRFGNKFVKFIS